MQLFPQLNPQLTKPLFSGTFRLLVPSEAHDVARQKFLEKSGGAPTWNVSETKKQQHSDDIDFSDDLIDEVIDEFLGNTTPQKDVIASWPEDDCFITIRSNYDTHELASDQVEGEYVLNELGLTNDYLDTYTRQFPETSNGEIHTIDLMELGLPEKLLLDPNTNPDSSIVSPLVESFINSKYPHSTEQLIQHPNINLEQITTNLNYTPLDVAIFLNKKEAFDLLIEAGAKISKCVKNSVSSLHQVVGHRNNSFLQKLIKALPEDTALEPALTYAIGLKEPEMVQTLLDAGANPYAHFEGKNMIQWAKKSKNKEIKEMFKALEVPEKLPRRQKPLMELAKNAVLNHNLDLLKAITKHKKFNANTYVYYPEGQKLLDIAVKADNEQAFELVKNYVSFGDQLNWEQARKFPNPMRYERR